MSKTNCPNCGAVMDSDKCQYCGTIMYDFACIDADNPFYIKIKRNGIIHRFKVLLFNSEISISSKEQEMLYFDDSPITPILPPDYTIGLTFKILPENGIIGLSIDPKEVGDFKPY